MYDAIVLAGGSGRRLGGIDKASLEVGGRSLLDRVLAATHGARRVVVAGPARELPAGVLGTSEQPAGGGPLAGLAAGLRLVEAPLVVVLACDLPFVSAATVDALVAALTQERAGRYDGAQLVDAGGRRQPLTAVYRTASLRTTLGAMSEVHGTPLHGAVALLGMLEVQADPAQAWDCDTWADVGRARERAHRLRREES